MPPQLRRQLLLTLQVLPLIWDSQPPPLAQAALAELLPQQALLLPRLPLRLACLTRLKVPHLRPLQAL